MGRLAYIYSPIFLKHRPGDYHPDRPERLSAVQEHLTKKGLFNRTDIIQPAEATKEQLCLVHESGYVDTVLGYRGECGIVLDIGDTVLSEHSVDAACLAAGSGITAVNLICEEKKYDSVFAAVRPPGHHAEYDHAKGFCIFNNLAIGVKYALTKNFARKILIIDWDIHHGNGTQNAFYNDNRVFYLSTHQYPFFPGSGRQDETGIKEGKGYTSNYPLPVGQGDDVFIHIIDEALKKLESFFIPDLVFISAGFDGHRSDPIGSMQMTEEGYYKLTELVARFAQKHCNGRIISILEGGYHLQSLAECVYRHVHCLLKH